MNVLSLFDGISCGQIALERVGIKVDKYYASEIEQFAIDITQKNYPKTIQIGDVFDIDYSKIDKIDLLIGGSPCTYWSNARLKGTGRELTPDGIGGQLFMQYVRALKETKSKYFLYENNNSMSKEIKKFITKELGVEPIMINSSLVSGQIRRRLYWTNIPIKQLPKDEIKEILDYLSENDYVRLDDNRNYKLLQDNEDKALLDYITNLQQEIEKLNDDKRGMLVQLYKANDDRDKVKQENEELKELCDKYEEEHNTIFKEWQKDIQANKKAIEYINSTTFFGLRSGKTFMSKYLTDLLSILRGDDE